MQTALDVVLKTLTTAQTNLLVMMFISFQIQRFVSCCYWTAVSAMSAMQPQLVSGDAECFTMVVTTNSARTMLPAMQLELLWSNLVIVDLDPL